MKNQGEIILYHPDESIALDVVLENETVWLTQQQIAELFGTQRPAITKHLANIYKSGELDKNSTCSILEHMGNEGLQRYKTKFYNLDAILSVGYRVNSINATLFRQWANRVLKEYLLKVYSIEFATKLIKSAVKSLVLIDNYVDESVLMMLAKRSLGVSAKIVTLQVSKQLQLDIEKFNRQYTPVSVVSRPRIHDRFLIIDKKDVYHIGASMKDLGKKMFAFSKMEIDADIILRYLDE